MNWVHKVRLRVFALVVASALVVVGVVSMAALPLWPVLGVAAATVALVVNRMTARLAEPLCWGCGGDVSKQPHGEYGVICPGCGAINERVREQRPGGNTLA